MDKILFPCKSGCGAPDGVDYTEAQDGVALCHYCGNVNAVPRKQLPDKTVLDLYNADHELFLCRFEDAREIYTKVIAMSPEEPQAYFGRALAKFRVKYLKDERYSKPDEAKSQPICYGTTDKLFSKDPDYLKALELATDKQKDVYAAQAREIDAIVANFQALKDKGVDYDTFICCKVTDDNGGYTSDCTDAQRIYHDLQKKGFKPFFSEMDMGDFTGSEYEAVILYALYTSESMLIVCSNEDYLDTPWVKNEYSRFLAMTANGYKQQGSLTFVYNRAPIEKLPNGKKIQGIDRSAYGSSEKIVDFVRKYLPQSQSDTKFCANCGAEVSAKTKYCPECGSREFVDTHDEFVKAQALAQARKEQQAREELFKKQQQEREVQLQKQQAEREEQLKKQQAAREEQWRKQIEEQQSREALLKKQQEEREEQLKKHQAAREEQLRREQQARDEELAALRRQLEEERNRKTQDAAAALAAQRTKEESERKAKEEAARKAKEEAKRKAREQARSDAKAEKYLKFQLNKDGKSYSVVGRYGYPTEITIPSHYKGLPVTEIGSQAFYYCYCLTAVTIPNSVTTISSSAFIHCSSLQTVAFDNDSQLQRIDKYAFSDCDLTSIIMPSSVTSIGRRAFADCSSLQTVAFDNDSQLQSIGEWAFADCNSLRSFAIPSSATSIVASIDKYAFHGCGSLTSIVIPSNVTGIKEEFFSAFNNLQNATLPVAAIPYIPKTSLQTVVINGGSKIPEMAFAHCQTLTSVTISSSVTDIDSCAFYNCGHLQTVMFDGDSQLQSIGYQSFDECRSLTSITIPSSVTSIGFSVFYGCSNLTQVTMPEKLAGVGENKLNEIFGERYKQISFTYTK